MGSDARHVASLPWYRVVSGVGGKGGRRGNVRPMLFPGPNSPSEMKMPKTTAKAPTMPGSARRG